MGYTQKIIHVEAEDWNAMPSGQRSEIIRKFIRDYNNALKGNLNDINLELLKTQIVSLENQKAKIDTELQSKRTILQNALKAQEESRVTKLQEEKERIENQKKCLSCKRILSEDEKQYKFTRGLVCRACFLTSGKDKIKEWSEP